MTFSLTPSEVLYPSISLFPETVSDHLVYEKGGDKRCYKGTSLMVQWLRLCSSNGGSLGLIPGQGTRSHMVQLRICMLQLKILHAATKTWCSQIGKGKSLSHIRLFVTPLTVAYQASQSMGFSRQEYCSGLPFPSPGDLPDLGIEPRSPTL